MGVNNLELETIQLAINQDEQALSNVMRAFQEEIRRLSTREYVSESGQVFYVPDSDMMLRLQTKLMLSIPKFHILPEEKIK